MNTWAFPPDAPLPGSVRLVEVGLRDGLQSVQQVLPTERKLELIRVLARAGVTNIQVTSFVSPSRVPQMADAEQLCTRLPEVLERHPEVRFSGLALNPRGVERLAQAGLSSVDLSLSASEPHSRRNTGMGVKEAEQKIAAAWPQLRRSGYTCARGCSAFSVLSPVNECRSAMWWRWHRLWFRPALRSSRWLIPPVWPTLKVWPP